MNPEMKRAMQRNPHLRAYLADFEHRTGELPEFMVQLGSELKGEENPNVLLPVGDPIFIHIYGSRREGNIRYFAVEPKLTSLEKKKYRLVLDSILELSAKEPVPENETELRAMILKLLDEVCAVSGNNSSSSNGDGVLQSLLSPAQKIPVSQQEYSKIQYYTERDIIGSGPIEPLIRDPYIEDIHCIGLNDIYIVHKIFDMTPTNVRFADEVELDGWMRSMSERIGRPVSDSRPIADGALPDGSRINIIYSTDVSRRGPSFTMRKFTSTPISIIQLIKWGTISPEIAAYLWLCLENGMSIFFSGETASGKTTMLNACLPFINPKSKVYSAEDTAEVLPPQPVWQQLITREEGPPESRVELFTLLKAALRSRPNYIIVGEIRGVEGSVAFQAMQTGHPVIATFHASSVKKMIQRLTGEPIKVPVTFVDNLNVAMILQAVYRNGRFLRRCTAVEEIEGYYEDVGGVITRAVFQWDPVSDAHEFRGLNNSFVLEDKIAKILGYDDPRQIYNDLFLRAKVLRMMIDNDIVEYSKVNQVFFDFALKGVDGLPFVV
ncbi:MAG: type II/IV secretion system ATPase subunit [Methermicoccaceae archaeon]